MEMIFIKSYKNLWNNIISDENIRLAIYNASHGNMKRKVLENMKRDPDKYIEAVRRWIENFEPAEHTPKWQMLTYISWTKCTDTYMWLKRHILSRVDFKKLRKIISNYDRRKKHGVLQVQKQQETACCR